MLLERISSPADVKALDASQLPDLCREIRDAIIGSSAAVGGHVGPNLGAVELTVALHRVFDSPRDKIVFDVSHQTYAHKMLTGRAGAFLDPARFGELSGFSNPAESPHDLFSMGHTSTSVSLACGLVKARELADARYDVVAVIGDGSLSGGLAFEGLDNLAALGAGAIVVVNDNGWSIAENHGGIYRNLAELRATGGRAERNLFRALGLDYRFLADGNDEAAVEAALTELRGTDRPVVLHICTEKGAGYAPAVADPEHWHHARPFDRATGAFRAPAPPAAGQPAPSYAELTGEHLLRRMAADPQVVAVSAATPYIMGFTPERRAAAGAQFVDVGIAEGHAVTFATALAAAGARPVLGVYGVFLQRAYDQLWHDLCLNRAPAVILDFGASVLGAADATHLGFFDLAMLGALPDLTCLAPVCAEEYRAMLDWALDQTAGPVVIRVPVGPARSRPDLAPAPGDRFDAPRSPVVRAGSEAAVLALGTFFELGERTCDLLAARHGVRPVLVNPRFATGLDTALLDELGTTCRTVVTIEDGVLEGGWGEKVARYLGAAPCRVRCYGVRKGFPDRYDPRELLAENGLTAEDIAADILRDLHRA